MNLGKYKLMRKQDNQTKLFDRIRKGQVHFLFCSLIQANQVQQPVITTLLPTASIVYLRTKLDSPVN